MASFVWKPWKPVNSTHNAAFACFLLLIPQYFTLCYSILWVYVAKFKNHSHHSKFKNNLGIRSFLTAKANQIFLTLCKCRHVGGVSSARGGDDKVWGVRRQWTGQTKCVCMCVSWGGKVCNCLYYWRKPRKSLPLPIGLKGGCNTHTHVHSLHPHTFSWWDGFSEGLLLQQRWHEPFSSYLWPSIPFNTHSHTGSRQQTLSFPLYSELDFFSSSLSLLFFISTFTQLETLLCQIPSFLPASTSPFSPHLCPLSIILPPPLFFSSSCSTTDRLPLTLYLSPFLDVFALLKS